MKKTIIRQGKRAEIKPLTVRTEKGFISVVYEICITRKEGDEEILIYFYVPELVIASDK